MPRLFTGIEISPETIRALAAMRGGLYGARWAEPDDYHLTLRFVGDVDTPTAEQIADVLNEIRKPAAKLEFAGLDWFGGGKPRAIVAKVKPTAALLELQMAHERAFRRLGLAPETRNYLPHVTLARMRGVSPFAVADYLSAHGDLTAPPFEASRFVLFSSRDGTGGGPYIVEAAYPMSTIRGGQAYTLGAGAPQAREAPPAFGDPG